MGCRRVAGENSFFPMDSPKSVLRGQRSFIRNRGDGRSEGSSLRFAMREEIDGKVAQSGQELVGFDESTGKLVHWFFGSTGVHGSGVWSRQGNLWMLTWQGIGPGGKKVEGTSDQILIDPDTYTWQMRDLRHDAKKIPDWPKVTLKKKTPTAAAFTAEDYIEFHKPLIGSWKATAEEAGKVYSGTATWQLAANKKCFLVSLELAGLPAAQFLMGYDPVDAKVGSGQL